MAASFQPAILEPIPPLGRFLTLALETGASPRRALASLREAEVEPGEVIGIGAPLALACPRSLDGLRAFPTIAGPGGVFPSTQGALWISLGGEDAGALLHRARRLLSRLCGFRIEEDVLAFRHAEGRDLSGFEDGTENPKGDRAREVAIVSGRGAGSMRRASSRRSAGSTTLPSSKP